MDGMKSRISGEPSSPLRACANNAATSAFPNVGCPRLRRARRYAALRQSREGGPSKTVDEDVGSRFMGKCFGVRLFEGGCFPVIGRGYGRSKPLPYGFEQSPSFAHGRNEIADSGVVRCPRLCRARRYALRQSRRSPPTRFAVSRQQCGYTLTVGRGLAPAAWHNAIFASNAATLAFPKEGKGDRRRRVDEDVGTCFMGKCFGVRLRVGGYRRDVAPVAWHNAVFANITAVYFSFLIKDF